jgi:hypothetical protein
MKFFGFISAGLIAAESSPVPFEFDDSEFYGPLQHVTKFSETPKPSTCCSTLKVWGDVALFSGRFDQSGSDHDQFPVYTASTGELKLFFNSKVNRWVVSNDVSNKADIRAVGGSTACPDFKGWTVWGGENFEAPDLVEPWSPYIAAPQLFECRPETFKAADLSDALTNKICGFMSDTKYCHQAKKVVEMVFADWENSSDNFITANMLMTANHVESLDQWHAALNSVILKRTWEMEESEISELQSYLKTTVIRIRDAFGSETWAAKDTRFLFLQ